jgi:hypothetical protein
MDDLVKFLAARLDEDEAAASSYVPPAGYTHRHAEGNGWRDHNHMGGGLPHQHDPDTARVLRRVGAGRKLLAEHDGQCCVKDACCGEITDWYSASDPCPSLRAYASEWDCHPDYRAEWKP